MPGFAAPRRIPAASRRRWREFFDMPKARLEGMGESGRRYYRRELSLAAGVDRFEEAFRAAAKGH